MQIASDSSVLSETIPDVRLDLLQVALALRSVAPPLVRREEMNSPNRDNAPFTVKLFAGKEDPVMCCLWCLFVSLKHFFCRLIPTYCL